MDKNTQTSRFFLQLIAAIFLFSSLTIYYRIPLAPIFNLFVIIYIYTTNYPFNRKRLVMASLFGIVFMRAMIPNELNFLNTEFYSAIINGLLITSLFILNTSDIQYLFNTIVKILAVILLLGLISFILQLLGVPIKPFTIFTSDDGRIYNVYYFHSSESVIDGLRFSSIFDEPGFLGTICAFILIIDGFNVNKRINFLFLLSGIFTFSLAFYIMSFAYLLFSTNFFRLKEKLLNYILIFIFFYIVYISYNEMFHIFFESRLSFDKNTSTLTGDNRGGILNSFKLLNEINLLGTIEFWMGHGRILMDTSKNIKEEILDSSWIRMIFEIGIFFFFHFIFMIFIYTKKKRENLLFSIIFILSIYQRPQIFNPLMILLLIVGSNLINERAKSKTGIKYNAA
jgi:hypothetical protein